MRKLLNLIIVLCAMYGVQGMANAEDKHSATRGRLLYDAHCSVCHSTQIHWRDRKLASDWESLVAQVRRWQYIGGLSWNEDEIKDVAHYLDELYYGYKNTVLGNPPAQLIYKK